MSSKEVRAATYVRVSRADQNSQMQTDETAELVSRRGWTLASRFGDEGISGSHDRRPAFQEMMAAARKRRFTVLVVFRCDRLFRSLRDLILTVDELATLGIGFVSVHENFDTLSPTGRLMMSLIASFAEFERSVLVERTKSGIAAARRRGARIGRPPVVVDLVKAKQLRAQGLSFREVAKVLGVGVGTLHRASKTEKRPLN